MDATGSPEATGEDLAAQFRRLQDDLKAIKETLAGKHAAGCNCAACAEEASKLAQHAKDEVHSAVAELEAYARKHPQYVVGGALGLGVVLGLLLGRK